MKLIKKLTLATCVGAALAASAASASEFVFFEKDLLENGRKTLFSDKATPAMKLAYNHLIEEAGNAYELGPFTVIDKTMTPPSGSKNDYMSISPYWWPDESKPDGLPWIRKDGKTNPASKTDATDSKRLGKFTRSVRALALAYYFTNDEKYATKAVEYLRMWFLDPKTRMNPNMNFAQGVPGIKAGRRSGLIDSRSFADRLLDSLVILENSKAWTEADEKGLKAWYTDYLDWLITSELGGGPKGELYSENNHGSWYDVQVIGIAYYLGKMDVAKEVAERGKMRIDTQFNRLGEQPHELARTRGWWYSFFNLDALTHVAQVADNPGVNIDLWNYKNSNGGSLLNGAELLAEYHDSPEDWPYAKKKTPRVMRAMPVYRKLALATGDKAMMKISQDGDWSQFTVTKNLGETWAERDVELIYRPMM